MTSVLGSALGGVKGAVLNALAKQTPLTAKEVHRIITSEGVKTTYQGVHKALGDLVEQGGLCKLERGYCLSQSWLSSVSQEVTALQSSSQSPGFTVFSKDSGRLSGAFHAITLFKHLLHKGRIKFSRDELFLFGNRIAFIGMSDYYRIYKRLEKIAPSLIYACTTEFGKEWFEVMRQSRFSNNMEDEIRFGIDSLSIAGWGGIEIDSLDVSKREARVTMNYSPFVAEYLARSPRPKHPVDDMVRGCLAGGFRTILGDNTLECRETKCLAKGDNQCVFEVGPNRKGFTPF